MRRREHGCGASDPGNNKSAGPIFKHALNETAKINSSQIATVTTTAKNAKRSAESCGNNRLLKRDVGFPKLAMCVGGGTLFIIHRK